MTLTWFYRNNDILSWWDNYLEDITREEECDSSERAILEELVASHNRGSTQSQPEKEIDLDIPEINDPIAPIIIGKPTMSRSNTGKELQEGDMVLLDSLRFTEQWPQVAQVVHLEEDVATVQWFWGNKTTPWTPATKNKTGQRGRREPYLLVFKKELIWHYGFNLTPSGMLPKSVRDKVDHYFD
ncbi:uncharacterized protein LOC128552403 [Mercenaria mercenaria]|uniref:uncharacterized protein LOC128552403 n=1 Tax=Mercenaria mercenaria TaxID=6596 RepID=UPI00234E80E3|nr:uncharacterized protein LOC128552403 [Mercenaria mercenaria]